MPFEHLQLLPVFQADDVIGVDRLLDRNGGFQVSDRLGLLLRLPEVSQGLVDGADQRRKVRNGDDIPAHIGGHELAGQCDQVCFHRLPHVQTAFPRTPMITLYRCFQASTRESQVASSSERQGERL